MNGIFLRRSDSGAAAGERVTDWGRLAFAAALLVALLAAALWTADPPAYAQLHSVVLHAFELVLGATLGILVGEAAHT